MFSKYEEVEIERDVWHSLNLPNNTPTKDNTPEGLECQKRHEFWKSLIPFEEGFESKKQWKKKRVPFAQVFGMMPLEFYEAYKDQAPDIILAVHSRLKEEEVNMANVMCPSTPCKAPSPTSGFFNIPTVSNCFVTFEARTDYLSRSDLNTLSKEDTKMADTYEQRRHLTRRLDRVANTHEEALNVAFHMNNEDAPETPSDFVKRIQEGKFEVNQKAWEDNYGEDGRCSYASAQYITWKDPTNPPDKEGFKAAKLLLDKAKTEATDVIQILEPKDGLEALKAFESKTFH